eukprot:scaffold408860_cov47-Prasinocladus_malaysianus.AAC.1
MSWSSEGFSGQAERDLRGIGALPFGLGPGRGGRDGGPGNGGGGGHRPDPQRQRGQQPGDVGAGGRGHQAPAVGEPQEGEEAAVRHAGLVHGQRLAIRDRDGDDLENIGKDCSTM